MNETNKAAFFHKLEEIIEDRIYITASATELEKEIEENMWCIEVSQSLAPLISSQEIKAFLIRIKQNRQRQLQESDVKVDLIYYLWNDPLAGQLRFNFINHSHTSLPFRSKIELVKTEEEIIETFLKLRLGITVDELTEISDEAEKVEIEHVVKVYSELIKNDTAY